jgi:hypothetical protein
MRETKGGHAPPRSWSSVGERGRRRWSRCARGGGGEEEEDGGNLTSKEHKVILPQCAAYQTRAQQVRLSLDTLPNTSKLHYITQA